MAKSLPALAAIDSVATGFLRHPHDDASYDGHAGQRISQRVPVAAQFVAVPQHKDLANCSACEHQHYQHYQHQLVLRMAPGKAVVFAEHGKQHWQGEVGAEEALLTNIFLL